MAKKKEIESIEIEEGSIPDRYIGADTYAKLSTEAGFKISPQSIRDRIRAGNMQVLKITGVEGVFIDKEAYPFGTKFPRGPKRKDTDLPAKPVKVKKIAKVKGKPLQKKEKVSK